MMKLSEKGRSVLHLKIDSFLFFLKLKKLDFCKMNLFFRVNTFCDEACSHINIRLT